MNRSYKVIWNASLNCFMAVSEYANSRGKSSGSVVSASTPASADIATGGTKLLRLSALCVGLVAAGFSLPAIAGYEAGGSSASTKTNCTPGIPGTSGTVGTGNEAAGAIAIGGERSSEVACAPTDDSIAIGGSASTKGTVEGNSQSIAIGTLAKASGDQSVALGANVIASGNSSVAIGGDDINKIADNKEKNDTYEAITGVRLIRGNAAGGSYQGTSGEGAGASAFGVQAYAKGDFSTALGMTSLAEGAASVALGVSSKATGEGALAIGAVSNASKKGSVALGINSKSDGENSIAIGSGSTSTTGANASGDNATSIGSQSSAAASATAIGAGAKANKAGGVAIGTGSIANIDAGIAGFDPSTGGATTETTNVWKSTRAGVALGDSATGITRQLTGLAAGTNDSDAVNVAQLNTVTNQTFKIQANNDTASAVKSSDTVQLVDGKNIKITRAGNNITIGTSSTPSFDSVTATGAVNAGSLEVTGTASLKGGADLNNQKISNVTDGTDDGDAVNKGQLDNVTAGSVQYERDINGVINYDQVTLAGTPAVIDTDLEGNSVVTSGGTSLSNVANGVNASDAVNKGQLDSTTSALTNAGLSFAGDSGDTVKRKLGDTLSLKGGETDSAKLAAGDNIGITTNADKDGLLVQLAKDIDLGVDGSVKTGNTVTNNDGVTITDGANITTMTGAGTNVTDGTNTSNYSANGFTATDKDGNNGITVNQSGVSFTDDTGAATGPVISAGGIDAKDTIIKNVGDAVDATDAVNKGQLDNVTAGSVQYERDINGVINYNQVTLAGTPAVIGKDANNNDIVISGGTKLSNVANGTVASDAVNKGQLDSTTSALTNAGLSFAGDSGDTVKRKLGDTLSLKGGETDSAKLAAGNNIGITTNAAKDGLLVQLAKDIAVDSVTTGNTVTNNDGITITDGANITTMTGAGTNVTDGTNTSNYGANGFTATDKDGNNGITVNQSGVSFIDDTGAATGPSITAGGINAGDTVLTGLANGSTDIGSTDAINGDQLNTAAGSIATNLGGTASYDPVTGTVTAPKYTLNKGDNTTATTEYDNVGDALGNLDGRTTTNTGDIANLTTGKAGIVRQDTGTSAITVGAATGGTSVDFSNSSNVERQLTGVASAGDISLTANEKNAVNAGDLNTAVGTVETTITNKGFALKAADGKEVQKNLGDAVDVIGSNGNITTQVADGKIEIALNNKLDLGADGSVTTGNTVTNNAGVKVDDGNGNITNLTATGTNVTDGTNTSNYGAKGFTATDVAGNTTIVNQGGVSFIDNAGAATGPSITAGGIDANGTKITNVANGVDRTDAVNKGQLDAITGNVIAGGVQYDRNTDDTINYDQVTLAGTPAVIGKDANNNDIVISGGTKLSNVANGTVASDAVNKGQLDSTTSALTNAGLQFSGDNETAFTRKLGEELKIRGGATEADLTDNNIGVVTSDDDTLTVKLNKDIDLGATGSVKTGNTVTNNAGVTITDGSKFTKVGSNGTNVTDGTNTSNYGATGFTAKDAAGNSTVVNQGGVSFINVAGNNIGPSITSTGINANSTIISNVADGINAKDAVNKSQLDKIISNNITDVETTDEGGKKVSVSVTEQVVNTNINNSNSESLFLTYNKEGQDVRDRLTIGETVQKMNTEGVKFAHTNYNPDNPDNPEKGSIGKTNDSSAGGDNSTAIGVNAIIEVDADSTVALGHDTKASKDAKNSVVIGKNSLVEGKSSVALGHNTLVKGESSIAIGEGAQALGKQSISIGTRNIVKGNNSGAFGDPSIINGSSSYSVGNNNTIGSNDSFVLGNNVTQTTEGSVVLGSDSGTTTQGGVVGYLADVTNINDAILATKSNRGAVAVGNASAGIYRQITGVAAGTADSDAVNVSQLKAVNDKIDNSNATLNDAAVQYDKNPNGTPNKGSISLGGGAAGTTITNVKGGDISAGSTDAVNGGQLHNLGSGVAGIIGGDAKYDADGNLTANNIGGTGKGTIDEAIKAVNQGNADNAGDIKNNSDNIQANTDKIDAGLNFGADTGATINKPIGDGTALKFEGGNNITTNATGGGIKFDLNGNISVDSVTTGNTTVDNKGVTIKDGASMTVDGIYAGNQTITGVADGIDINDAVNIGQLNALDKRIGNSINELGYKIGEVKDEANAGISAAMAMSSLPQAYIPGKSMVGGGIATYNGQSAVAIGVSKVSDNGRWVIKANGTADTQGNAGGAVGAGFHF